MTGTDPASTNRPKRIRHSDVPTHVDELDSMLGDESANEEAGSRIQQFSRMVHCEKAIHDVSTSIDVWVWPSIKVRPSGQRRLDATAGNRLAPAFPTAPDGPRR